MTTRHTSPSRGGVQPPRLSDEAAVEIFLILDDLFMLFESYYGDQISRHFDSLCRHNLAPPDFDSPLDDPPF